MLLTYWEMETTRRDIVKEFAWLGEDITDFAERMPKHHRLRQVYMFSPNYDYDQAFHFICNNVDFVMELENYNDGLLRLARYVGRTLPVFRVSAPGIPGKAISNRVEDRIREEMRAPGVYAFLQDLQKPEYLLRNRLRKAMIL
jgi:hypothetical protein